MRLLIISDLHICAPGMDIDKFQWGEDEFISTLVKMKNEKNIDKVIINGDIYDLYFFDYNDIKKGYQKLSKMIEESDWVIPLRGNHDELLTKFDDFFIIGNILIEHGNKGDVNGLKFLSDTFYFFAKIMDSIILKVPFLRKKYLSSFRQYASKNESKAEKNTLNYIRYGLDRLRYFDVVVFGHTHQLQKMELTYGDVKKNYYNCGTCTGHRFQGVVLDTNTGAGELIDVLP